MKPEIHNNKKTDLLKKNALEEEMEQLLKKKEIQNSILNKIIENIHKENDNINKTKS